MSRDRDAVLRRRIFTQRLVGRKLSEPEDVVRLLTAVQSQEYAHGFWSLGMRTRGSTYADVKSAFDEGRILRTHMLRTTWHFVTPEDIRWILGATSPRVLTVFGSHFRSLGLDERTQRSTTGESSTMLEGGTHLTRKEIGAEPGTTGVTTRWRAADLHRDERRAPRADLQRADARRTAHLRGARRAGAARPDVRG